MGMSATQARLLSITSRLTNNEFRSQTITNSKLRLATESQEASQAYMDALDSKQIMFMNYDDNGEASKTPLTAAVLYDYAPMKNQYMITNTSGKYLVSNQDAENFQNSENLFDFLDKYDLVYELAEKTQTVYDDNPEYADWKIWYDDWKTKEPDKTSEIYWEEIPGSSSSELYDKFLNATIICYSGAMGYLSYQLGLPGETIYDSKGNMVGSYTPQPECAPGYTGRECYVHVLAHLLLDGEYTTSTGATLGVGSKGIDDTGDGGTTHWWQGEQRYTDAQELANLFVTENYLCCAEDSADITSSSTDIEKLMSDYYIDKNSNTQTKSLLQKVVDLAYLMLMQEATDQQLYDAIQHFVNHDLNVLKEPERKFKEEEYQSDLDEWHKQYREEPDKYIERIENIGSAIILRDQEKSQWYTNLWHAMNGSENANVVDPINFDSDVDYIKSIPEDIRSEYRFIVENSTKDIHHTNYEVIDLNLNDSAEWLEFALEHGAVTLQQTKYYNPAEDNNKTANLSADGYYWENIVYTSARDFVTIDDEKAIAIAEVKYKKAITEIENKDKKFDQDLKKLDTEHNALQTEYESMKEVLSKNVQRSFKAFS